MVSLVLVACAEDELGALVVPDGGPSVDAGPSPGPVADAAATDAASVQDASDDAPDTGLDACGAASAGLAAVADAEAPVLDASLSNLRRVTSNDAFCTGQKAGAHPSFGSFGYSLNVFLHDAEGDAASLSDLVSTPGLVRLGASPAFDVTTKYDPDHGWTTQGEGFILQVCLDEIYPPGSIVFGVDAADTNGHRSRAICVREASEF